ncbi:MAG: hypothetical protein BMS9Abin28_0817 [Anaerolineae bacterium]|nr:MAG: hypothetical protein BMS9Abin28_0817 [Anaerolineae bacterium]
MIDKIRSFFRGKPARLAIGLTLLLAATDVTLVAASLRSDRAAAELASQVEALEFSLEQLRVADAEGLNDLESELSTASADLLRLEASFPEIGAPFDLYRRVFQLASSRGIDLKSVRRIAGSIQDTGAGTLSVTTYVVDSAGALYGCLSLLADLEREGLQTLTLNNILVDPTAEVCDFGVTVARATVLGSE